MDKVKAEDMDKDRGREWDSFQEATWGMSRARETFLGVTILMDTG